MTHFKTSKAELLFVVLPKGAYDVKISQLIGDRQKIRTRNESMPLPQGNWQLIGKLSEVSEEVAKGLVESCTIQQIDLDMNKIGESETKSLDYSRKYPVHSLPTALESLTSIATHLGMELTDNIYILKRIV